MRLPRVIIYTLLLMLVLTGCGGSDGEQSTGAGAGEQTAQSEGAQDKQVPEETPKEIPGEPKGKDWVIRVDDTVSGTYDIPMTGKPLDYEITLGIMAVKTGGEDIYGEYEGVGYITFGFDESKMSDQELMYIGGGAFNRECKDLKFEIVPFDQEKYIESIPPLPGEPRIAPLGNFNGMATFRSDWVTKLKLNQQVIDRETGKTLTDQRGSYTDGESVPMGITILVAGERVTVDIPTYGKMWGAGYFYGSITEKPYGEGGLGELKSPFEDGNGAGSPGNGRSMPGPDAGGSGEAGMNDSMSHGQTTFNPDGTFQIDTNGDGVIDMYMDAEGNMYMDIDGDGIPEKIESEFSDG
ncbi:MAG TPA: hypothetical protein VFF83_00280 [Clostridia bacterium]|nr:hypothetical protein [Clostridia bacterium]